LIFNLTFTVMNLIDPLTASGLPVVMFSQPYSGHDWSQWSKLLAKGRRVEIVASSDFSGLEGPLRVLAARHQIRQSRVLCVRSDGHADAMSMALENKFGAPIESVHYYLGWVIRKPVREGARGAGT